MLAVTDNTQLNALKKSIEIPSYRRMEFFMCVLYSIM